MQVYYSLSAPAKGKIERPYRWLQDRIIRRCAREQVENIVYGRIVLQQEVQRYNEEQTVVQRKSIESGWVLWIVPQLPRLWITLRVTHSRLDKSTTYPQLLG